MLVLVFQLPSIDLGNRHDLLGVTVGHGEPEPFWIEFLRSVACRPLRWVKLVTPDAHEGLKAAVTKGLGATR